MQDWRTGQGKKSLIWFSSGFIPPPSTPVGRKNLTFCNLHSNKCATPNFCLFFWTDRFFAVTWSYPVHAEGDLQRQMRQEFISVFLTRWAASAAEAKAVPSVLAGFSGSQATERISLRHQLIERRADLLTWRMFSHPERKSWCANRAKLLPQGCPLSLTVLSRCLLWSVPWLTRGSLEQRLKEQKETASRIGRSFFSALT